MQPDHCYYCVEKHTPIDYKVPDALRYYTSAYKKSSRGGIRICAPNINAASRKRSNALGKWRFSPMLEPNDLKKGVIFKYRGHPVQVLKFSHSHKGRGSAVVTVKIRDMITEAVQTLTLKAGEKLDDADLARESAHFLYADQNAAYCMAHGTFEQLAIDRFRIESKLRFLKEGQSITVLTLEGQAIDVELPPKVELSVCRTEPGVKGDTASGTAYKPAEVESGYTLNVPLFVKTGDVIRLNTETGEYVERVS